MCYIGIRECTRDDDTKKYTTVEGPSLHTQKKLVRRIMGVKIADKRRMDELRVEVRLNENAKKKLIRSRLKWAGRVERMGDEKVAKRANI